MVHEATCNCAKECMTDCRPQRARLTGDSAAHIYRNTVLTMRIHLPTGRFNAKCGLGFVPNRGMSTNRQVFGNLAGSRRLELAGRMQCTMNAGYNNVRTDFTRLVETVPLSAKLVVNLIQLNLINELRCLL